MTFIKLGCSFEWKIEKVNQLNWFKKGTKIESPTFSEDSLMNTKWSLILYPMGNDDKNAVKNILNLYLHRERNCNGPDLVRVNFKIELRCEKSSIWMKRTVRGKWFPKDYSYSVSKMFHETKSFSPGDTVIIRFVLWNCLLMPTLPSDNKLKHTYARTIFTYFDRFFVWSIDKFSTLESSLKNGLKVGFFDFVVHVNSDEGSEKGIVINLNSLSKRMNFFSFATRIVDSEEKTEECGFQIYYSSEINQGVLSYAPQRLIENLPNGVFSLHCQYAYSVETVSSEFPDRPIASSNGIQRRDVLNVERGVKSETASVLADTLKSVYSESIWSDFELRTMTRTFKVHKSILSARSPVFRRMFSSNMLEQTSGYVDISDLDDDTIHQMLLYMYAESVDHLHFVSATKLYSAADKYQVLGLREKCSTFLKTELWPTTVCDILVLADLHRDKDLEGAAHSYILDNEDVFKSVEWEGLMKVNPKLANDVLYRKVYPNDIYRLNT